MWWLQSHRRQEKLSSPMEFRFNVPGSVTVKLDLEKNIAHHAWQAFNHFENFKYSKFLLSAHLKKVVLPPPTNVFIPQTLSLLLTTHDPPHHNFSQLRKVFGTGRFLDVIIISHWPRTDYCPNPKVRGYIHLNKKLPRRIREDQDWSHLDFSLGNSIPKKTNSHFSSFTYSWWTSKCCKTDLLMWVNVTRVNCQRYNLKIYAGLTNAWERTAIEQ